jgi:hypothetical protein
MLCLMSTASSLGGRSTHCLGGFIERPPAFSRRWNSEWRQDGLLGLMLGADVYVSNTSGIFKAVPQ